MAEERDARRADMTVDEAASCLFVSREHMQRLLDCKKLLSELDVTGECIDDDASVHAYQSRLEEAWPQYLAAQDEADGPLGL